MYSECPKCRTSISHRDDAIGTVLICPRCTARVKILGLGLASVETDKTSADPIGSIDTGIEYHLRGLDYFNLYFLGMLVGIGAIAIGLVWLIS